MRQSIVRGFTRTLHFKGVIVILEFHSELLQVQELSSLNNND